MKEFSYIWAGEPIDFWENAIVTSIEEYDRVMAQMPEEARAEVVLKTYVPTDGELSPVYMCKADNNGTIYYFSDFDFISFYQKTWKVIKNG